MEHQSVQLKQQRRMSQFGSQQLYAAQLRQQQRDLLAARDFATDPWVSAPHMYGYVANGANRQTNQYGAEVLRQAVRNGYAQGYRAGQSREFGLGFHPGSDGVLKTRLQPVEVTGLAHLVVPRPGDDRIRDDQVDRSAQPVPIQALAPAGLPRCPALAGSPHVPPLPRPARSGR